MIKVLALDDANVIRSLIKLTLEGDGMQVDACATIDEAVVLANQNQYDLIIVDYLLDDGHNGLELVKSLQSSTLNSASPCLVLSAEDSQEYKNQAVNLEVKAWLKKPFKPQNLMKLVHQITAK